MSQFPLKMETNRSQARKRVDRGPLSAAALLFDSGEAARPLRAKLVTLFIKTVFTVPAQSADGRLTQNIQGKKTKPALWKRARFPTPGLVLACSEAQF